MVVRVFSRPADLDERTVPHRSRHPHLVTNDLQMTFRGLFSLHFEGKTKSVGRSNDRVVDLKKIVIVNFEVIPPGPGILKNVVETKTREFRV